MNVTPPAGRKNNLDIPSWSASSQDTTPDSIPTSSGEYLPVKERIKRWNSSKHSDKTPLWYSPMKNRH